MTKLSNYAQIANEVTDDFIKDAQSVTKHLQQLVQITEYDSIEDCKDAIKEQYQLILGGLSLHQMEVTNKFKVGVELFIKALSKFRPTEKMSLNDRRRLFTTMIQLVVEVYQGMRHKFTVDGLNANHLAELIQTCLKVEVVKCVFPPGEFQMVPTTDSNEHPDVVIYTSNVDGKVYDISKEVDGCVAEVLRDIAPTFKLKTKELKQTIHNWLMGYSPMTEVSKSQPNQLVFQDVVYHLDSHKIDENKSGYYLDQIDRTFTYQRDEEMYQFIDYLFESWSDGNKGLKQLLIQMPIYALEGNGRKKLVVLMSDGGGGKSTYVECIRNLISSNAKDNSFSVNIDELGDGDVLSEISTNKSFIYGDDLETNPKLIKKVGNLKSLISGMRIYVDRKYSHPVPVHFKGLWIQNTNHAFTFNDFSPAIHDRILFVKWTNHNFRREKCELPYSLDDCLNQSKSLYHKFITHFMHYCLDHYIYQDAFYITEELQQFGTEQLDQSNTMRQFVEYLKECSLFDYKVLSLNMLYPIYLSWCEIYGSKATYKLPKFNELLTKELSKLYPDAQKKKAKVSYIARRFPVDACEKFVSTKNAKIHSIHEGMTHLNYHQVILLEDELLIDRLEPQVKDVNEIQDEAQFTEYKQWLAAGSYKQSDRQLIANQVAALASLPNGSTTIDEVLTMTYDAFQHLLE